MIFQKITESNAKIIIFFAVVTSVTFIRAIFFPYIHDDWHQLERAINNSFSGLIMNLYDSFFTGEREIIRIAGPLHLWLMERLFGLNTVMPHLIAFFMHALNAFLVFRISEPLLRNREGAFAVGFLYATATIHSETMTWITGLYDAYSMLFFLLSFLMVIKARYGISAFFYILSLVVKEYAVAMPAIFILYYVFYENKQTNVYERIRTGFSKAKYLIGAFVLFIVMKIAFWPRIELPDSHPYKVKIWGMHLLENITIYLKFAITEIFPTSLFLGRSFFEFDLMQEMAILGIMLSVLVFYFMKLRKNNIRLDWRLIVFCAFFFLAGLGTVLLLPNHNYRYYLTISSVSFLIVFVYLFQQGLKVLHIPVQKQNIILICYLIFHFVLSTLNYNMIFSNYSSKARQIEMIEAAQEFLSEHYPELPKNTVIILKGTDIFAFSRNSAFRIWYDDPTLEVYNFSHLAFQDGRYVIKNPILTQVTAFTGKRENMTVELQKAKTVILEYKDKSYIDITDQYIK